MNCANHPEAPVSAYCRTCGKPLCIECKREALGTIFCAEHAPAATVPPPPPIPDLVLPPGHLWPPPPASASVPLGTKASPGGASPALAFFLGFIPGVGAIYNGQYAKGLIHAVVFGMLVSILDSHAPRHLEPLFGILLAAWIFYMAIEAYHTARRRRSGLQVEEFSSIIDIRRQPGRFPLGAIVLIGLGFLLLLDQVGLVSIDRLIHLWPVALILIGVYRLYLRVEDSGAHGRTPASDKQVSP